MQVHCAAQPTIPKPVLTPSHTTYSLQWTRPTAVGVAVRVSYWLQLVGVRGVLAMSDVENVDTVEILEISTEKLDEINVRKKKNSLLNEVLVTGLLKNINDKVNNKLDNEAQSELIDIINEKVKDGYEGGLIDLESEVEKAISFDEGPTDDHIINTANKNRVKLPANRRLPTRESKLSLNAIQEKVVDTNCIDNVDEDFENFFKNENDCESTRDIGQTESELTNKSSDSYIDDFDALLNEEGNLELVENKNDAKFNVDADFDALLKEENIEFDPIDQESLFNETIEQEIEERVTDTNKGSFKEHSMGNSIEDIYEELEKNEHVLLERKTLIENGLLDDNDEIEDLRNHEEGKSNKGQSDVVQDPFDDLFDELDETSLDDIDKGFQQIYANGNKGDNALEAIPSSSSNVDKDEECQLIEDVSQTQTANIDTETEKETVTELLQDISETQVKLI